MSLALAWGWFPISVVTAQVLPALRPGEPVDGEIVEGDAVVHTALLDRRSADVPAVGKRCEFVVPEAGTWTIELRSYLFDAYLVLRDDTDRVLAEDDDGLLGSHARIVATDLRPDSTYRVDATALHGNRGPFELVLLPGPPPDLSEQERAAADIADAERALAARERVLGPNDPGLARSMRRLGILLMGTQGDSARARSLLERSQALAEATLGPDHPDVAESLINLGVLMRQQRDYAGARSNFERGLAIWETALGPEHPAVALALDQLAFLLQELGDYARARPLFERSLAIAEKLRGPDHPEVAQRLSNLASILEDLGDLAEARSLLERSVAILEKSLGRENLKLAPVLQNLGHVLSTQGDIAGARAALERSLALNEKWLGPEHPNVATSLTYLAGPLRAQGDFAGARALGERSLAIREKALGPEDPVVAGTLNDLVGLLMDQGDYAGARPLCERSLAILETAWGPEHPEVARVLASLSDILTRQGDFVGALPLAERSLAIVEKSLGREHLNVGTALGNLAYLRSCRGDYAGARPLFERSLAILEKSLGREHPSVGIALNNLAQLLRSQRDLAGARALNERALAIQEKALGPDHPRVAFTLNDLASLLEEQGDYAGARPLAERSVAILETAFGPEHPEVAASLSVLAKLLLAEGDFAGARPSSERCLSIREKTLGPGHPRVTQSLGILIMVNLGLGDAAAAARLARQLEDTRSACLSRLLAGMSESDFGSLSATAFWQLELEQSPALRDARRTASYEALLAWKGQLLRVARSGRSALREQLGSDGRALADHLHDVCAALSRSSTDMAHGEQPLDAHQLEELVQERQRLERELASRTTDLLPGVPTWAELRAALPVGSALVDVLVHRTYEPARRDGTTVIERERWTEPRISAWITRAESAEPVHVDLGPEAAIAEALHGALTRLIGGRGASVSAAPVDAGAALRRLVWDPLAAQLDGIETVIVSPDGVLGGLPFEILRGDDGRYLVEDRSFTYLTDPTDLLRMTGHPAAAQDELLAVGGVDYQRGEGAGDAPAPLPVLASASTQPATLPRGGWAGTWSALPATESEARGIAAQHAEAFADEHARGTVLAGAAATEEQLKALLPRFSTVHLATHGYFNPEGLPSLDDAARQEADRDRDGAIPGGESVTDVARRLEGYSPGLLSGLVCAGANASAPLGRDDGYLTAEEVGWLDLSHADLVVLSACDTGLGRPKSGEGLIGLRRAFLTAGARTVISSLWSVPDQETAELMDLFYRNLWQEKVGKHAALRAAQLEMIARNRERHDGDARPVTWGAFVLDGDWR